MFTGIIESVGSIQQQKRNDSDMQLTINTGAMDMSDVVLGDSIAVNGVCLTVIRMSDDSFVADVSGETLDHTTADSFVSGRQVNLEKALTASSRLGGHMVSGHVDGIGKIVERKTDGQSERFRVEHPESLARYIARKGSICIDGISLTVNSVDGNFFDINIVPHTIENTTMSDYKVGTEVNLEVDVIARYLERLLLSGTANEKSTLNIDTLRRNGFIE